MLLLILYNYNNLNINIYGEKNDYTRTHSGICHVSSVLILSLIKMFSFLYSIFFVKQLNLSNLCLLNSQNWSTNVLDGSKIASSAKWDGFLYTNDKIWAIGVLAIMTTAHMNVAKQKPSYIIITRYFVKNARLTFYQLV